MSNVAIAELSGATKRFGKTVALDQADLQARPGELLAVLGPNGAGKTTAISLLLGLMRPDSGSARLFGRSPEQVQTRRGIGVMMQEVVLAPELRVREHITLVSSYYPEALALNEVLKISGTAPLAGRAYGKLSGGQKRQAQFAMAICGLPRLLFLDEPTVGLDIQARRDHVGRAARPDCARRFDRSYHSLSRGSRSLGRSCGGAGTRQSDCRGIPQ